MKFRRLQMKRILLLTTAFSIKFIWLKSMLVNPPRGNKPVFCEKINIKIAKKKEGIAIPTLDRTVKTLSNSEL